MKTLSYKTISATKENADKKWWLVDAEGETLGRVASRIAMVLRGKHKTNFTPHADCGDYVVVINAEKVHLTGKKLEEKQYIRHTGYPGGQRVTTPKALFANKPEEVLKKAVQGMLPKNRLGRAVFKNMYIYAGTEHKQEAQKPEKLDINTIK